MANIHKEYQSIGEAVAELRGYIADPESCPEPDNLWHWLGQGDEWSGGSTQEALQWAEHGNPAFGDRIRDALEKLGAVELPATDRWQASPVGFLPNVPAFVSGSPNSMWRRKVGEQPRPVRIYVSSWISCRVGSDEITARGAAIAALLQYLKSRAPVELFTYCATGLQSGSGMKLQVIRVQSETLDPDVAAFLFCSPASLRRIFGPLSSANGGDRVGTKRMEQEIRQAIGVGPRDIVIPDHTSQDFFLKSDGAAWVRETAEKALAGE